MPGRLRAPAEDGAILAVPPLAEADRLFAAGSASFRSSRTNLLGRSLADLRALARTETLAAARQVHAELDLPSPSTAAPSPLIATGHQPDLFHPGVWIKHFAASRLARVHEGCSLSVIIDGDVAKTSAIRVPVRRGESLQIIRVPFDRWNGAIVFEERPVLDEALFAGFANEVQIALRGSGWEPILPRFWAEAIQLRARTPLLGLRIAGARRRWEESWNCHNWEVPMSRLCRTEAFAWFACHLLAELPRFREAHNRRLAAFRAGNRIRDPSRPMPDLIQQGGWLAAPFWVRPPGQHRRERVFVRPSGGELELWNSAGLFGRLPAANPEAMVQAWRAFEDHGYKLRTRALTTTLFLRLFVADLFIHGIGGAIYDAVTDGLIQDFYGPSTAPPFLTLSATLRLPLTMPKPPTPPLGVIARRLRDLHFNPDRHLPAEARAIPEVEILIQAKRDLVARAPTGKEAKRTRFNQLRQLNERLRHYAASELVAVETELRRAELIAGTGPIVRDREYAFCLYPEEKLLQLFRGIEALQNASRQDSPA